MIRAKHVKAGDTVNGMRVADVLSADESPIGLGVCLRMDNGQVWEFSSNDRVGERPTNETTKEL